MVYKKAIAEVVYFDNMDGIWCKGSGSSSSEEKKCKSKQHKGEGSSSKPSVPSCDTWRNHRYW